MNKPKEHSLPFTVASALLKELGERLVGQPHIALSELIKNAYDADASAVNITIDPKAGRIEIIDNGHGMNFQEFKDYWMSIGSTHKVEQKTSRNLSRKITGSKGVGRLSVQFLARKIELTTVSEYDSSSELYAYVDWDQAVKAGLLTKAEARITVRPCQTGFPEGKNHGTRILLTDLNQEWHTDDFKALARQVWWLQPPLVEALPANDPNRFAIGLSSPERTTGEVFETIAKAALNLWHARLRGRLKRNRNDCHIELSLDFHGGKHYREEYPLKPCLLHKLDFDIRVFHFMHRQPHGISVQDAREYLRHFGGVGIYDIGFRLPYYGSEGQDWLGIEFDHSHRIHRSELLPDALQVLRGMQFLPTNSRLFGIVEVNTALERSLTPETERRRNRHLQIQITRDRLVQNESYSAVRDAVRWAIDYYATRESLRNETDVTRRLEEPPSKKLRRVEDVLHEYKKRIPADVYGDLRERIRDTIQASETESARTLAGMNLLGALATAGIVALASEHETNQQFRFLQHIIAQLKRSRDSREDLTPLVADFEAWLNRARSSRALFAPLIDREGREERRAYRASAVLSDIARRVAPLARGIPIETSGVEEGLRLPPATLAAWNAIFQNILLNAVNALIDREERRILVSSGAVKGRHCIWVQDTGVGVDLDEAESLFQAFERRLSISPERKRLGLGGTGLGLTIVRMLAGQAGCEVSFTSPDKGYSTKFQLCWKESM